MWNKGIAEKRSAPYFNGKSCRKGSACSAVFSFAVDQELVLGFDVYIICNVQAYYYTLQAKLIRDKRKERADTR